MPSAITVGAQLGVVFKAQSYAAREGSTIVLPVSKDLISIVGSVRPVFMVAKLGFAGLLARRPPLRPRPWSAAYR